MSDKNPDDIKKELRKIYKSDPSRLRVMASNFDLDHEEYSWPNGLIDEITEKMMKDPEEPPPEPEEPKKKGKKKTKPEPAEEPAVDPGPAKKGRKKKPAPEPEKEKEPPPTTPEKPKKKGKNKAEEQQIPNNAPDADAGGESKTHWSGGRLSERNPGVCLFVVELLKGATKENPLTKDQIADAVADKFPDRDKEKSRNKARACKSWMKIHYNMELSERRTEIGTAFWLTDKEYRKGLKWMEERKNNRRKKKEGSEDE